jgi:hypothetical protein
MYMDIVSTILESYINLVDHHSSTD